MQKFDLKYDHSSITSRKTKKKQEEKKKVLGGKTYGECLKIDLSINM